MQPTTRDRFFNSARFISAMVLGAAAVFELGWWSGLIVGVFLLFTINEFRAHHVLVLADSGISLTRYGATSELAWDEITSINPPVSGFRARIQYERQEPYSGRRRGSMALPGNFGLSGRDMGALLFDYWNRFAPNSDAKRRTVREARRFIVVTLVATLVGLVLLSAVVMISQS